jgi:hypothetical protein
MKGAELGSAGTYGHDRLGRLFATAPSLNARSKSREKLGCGRPGEQIAMRGAAHHSTMVSTVNAKVAACDCGT